MDGKSADLNADELVTLNGLSRGIASAVSKEVNRQLLAVVVDCVSVNAIGFWSSRLLDPFESACFAFDLSYLVLPQASISRLRCVVNGRFSRVCV